MRADKLNVTSTALDQVTFELTELQFGIKQRMLDLRIEFPFGRWAL